MENKNNLKSNTTNNYENQKTKQYAAKDDIRAFAPKSPMMSALMDGGCLHAFVELVKEKEDLVLCFRGNSGQQCTVYYNNNEFFKIRISSNEPKVSFNSNHARYWDREKKENIDFLNTLIGKYGFKEFITEDKIGSVTKKEFRNNGRIYSLDELRDIYRARRSMLESYFSENDKHDFYLTKDIKNKGDWRIEKQEQQKLMSFNTNRENGYYIYDMEYTQAFASQPLKDEYMDLCGNIKQNKPDSLAIRYVDGKPTALVFIELKSTEAGMKGSSGAIDHMEGMRKYIDNTLNKEFIVNRKKEARSMIECYQKLNLHNCGNKEIEDFSQLPIELLLVITDNATKSAKAYYEKFEKDINAKAKETHCGLLFLENGKFELKYENVVIY